MYQSIEGENEKAVTAMKEETASALGSVKADVTSLEEKIAALSAVLEEVAANAQIAATAAQEQPEEEEPSSVSLENIATELKYGYQQNQMIYESLSSIITGEVLSKVTSIEEKIALVGKLDETIAKIDEKIAELKAQEVDYGEVAETVKEKVVAALDVDAFAETVKEKLLASLPIPEDVDYDKIIEAVAEKTEACAVTHTKEIQDSIGLIPLPENVDYTRIAEETSEKVAEKTENLIGEKLAGFDPIDYDKVIYGVTEKVVESLPYPEKVDYARIDESFQNAKTAAIDEDALVAKIAEAVLARIPQPEPIDYDALADAVIARMPQPEPIDYDKLADAVASKIVIPETEAPTYELFVDEDGANAIAEKVQVPAPEKVEIDYAQLAEELIARQQTPSYEMLLDEVGAAMIADAVAEKLHCCKLVEETVEEPVEEPAPEEEVVEDTVEEPIEEEVVEEPVEEAAPQEEVAVTEEPTLIDADDGLVVRYKRSFEAKLRQNTPDVKAFYGMIKNAFDSYKRINANMSWHGDRFNFGRDTIARMSINGKTLCLYVALDPNDPELKSSVYHQKDLSGQKAYENTPFMMKIKSETAAKRAVRLIAILAESKGAEKDEAHADVDYVEVFAPATDEELIEQGLIKVTKEKKVVLSFN
jgi:hypothetical protein